MYFWFDMDKCKYRIIMYNTIDNMSAERETNNAELGDANTNNAELGDADTPDAGPEGNGVNDTYRVKSNKDGVTCVEKVTTNTGGRKSRKPKKGGRKTSKKAKKTSKKSSKKAKKSSKKQENKSI